MFFHASQVSDIKVLTPHTSDHGKPLVYFSEKRENVLVYLSNAAKKYCIENGISCREPFPKWATYGFNRDGIQVIDEYYPNALMEAYKGVSGYIYRTSVLPDCKKLDDIPYAAVSKTDVAAEGCEFVPDAYEAMLSSAEKNMIIIRKYTENSTEKLEWIRKTVRAEYEQAAHCGYRLFLEAKFDFLHI